MSYITKINLDEIQYSTINTIKKLNVDGVLYDIGLDTSDANAIASDIKQGKTAYVNGSKITGSLVPYGPQTITPTTKNQSFGPGVYLNGQITVLGSSSLIPGNIKSGVNIFGVVGNLSPSIDVEPLVMVVMAGQEGYEGWYYNTSGVLTRTEAGGTLNITIKGTPLYAKLTFVCVPGLGFDLNYNIGGNSGVINSNGPFRELEFTSFSTKTFTTNLSALGGRDLHLIVLGKK